MRKVRKEFLSGAQNKRCVPRLRAELTALMFVSKKAKRKQNMMSNAGLTKALLLSHVTKFSNSRGAKTSLKLEPKTIPSKGV